MKCSRKACDSTVASRRKRLRLKPCVCISCTAPRRRHHRHECPCANSVSSPPCCARRLRVLAHSHDAPGSRASHDDCGCSRTATGCLTLLMTASMNHLTIAGARAQPALHAIGHSIEHDTCSPAPSGTVSNTIHAALRATASVPRSGGGGAGLTAQACSSLAEAWEPCWAMRDSRLSYW